MNRHSPARNQRSKGIKIKHVVQVCLLIAVCFWLIFQVKRSHDKKTRFHADNPKISLNTHADEIVKFGRKDLQPKLEETTTGIEMHEEDTQEQEDEEENKHDEDEDKIEEEKDNGGEGGDDDNEQEKPNMEIDRDEVDIIDEESEEEKDGPSLVDHDEDGSTEHAHEAREEHYKADDASSAVITHEPGNGTFDDNSSENVEDENGSIMQEKDTSPNITSGDYNATESEGFSKKSEMLKSTESENLEEKEVQNDLERLPGIETESAAE